MRGTRLGGPRLQDVDDAHVVPRLRCLVAVMPRVRHVGLLVGHDARDHVTLRRVSLHHAHVPNATWRADYQDGAVPRAQKLRGRAPITIQSKLPTNVKDPFGRPRGRRRTASSP